MILDVVKWPADVLETPAETVESFDEEFRDFVEGMKETMDANQGIGLAANQVGVLKRVFVVKIPFVDSEQSKEESLEKQEWHDKTYVFVNPEIVEKSGRVKSMEGCLSFPEIYEYVPRAEKVRVKAQDEFGQPFEIDASELFSICIQHELDHINGIVFVKRMSRLKASLVRAKLAKA